MRYRSTVASIHLPNLYENYINVQKLVGNKTVIPVVKANAYGHGSIQVTEYLYNRGVDYFAVSLLEEALILRENFSEIDILIMGIVESSGLIIANDKRLIVTISNFDQIKELYEINEIYKYIQEHADNFSSFIENVKSKDSTYNNQTFSDVFSEFLLSFVMNENSRHDSSLYEKFHKYISSYENLITVFKNAISKNTLNVHIKIDTGMNRLGFKSTEEIFDSIDALINSPSIYLQGIYTHFSTADVDKSYYDIQMRKFKSVLEAIEYNFEMIHISNSSSQIKFEKDIPFTTHTRLGISLYGLTLDKDMDFLKSTFYLRTKFSQFKYLVQGDKVGYGATYTAEADEIIGILPIGYADGFIRKNQGGFVEINNKRYEIVGRICMDQMFIKIDDSVTKDDDVYLFGDLVTIDEVAERLDTINYEVICLITDRVPREYIAERGREE